MPDQIQTLLQEKFPDHSFELIENCSPGGFTIPKEILVAACHLLHTNEHCYFDHLASLSGLDNGPEENTMEVIYTLYSIPNDQHLTIKVVLDREKPAVDSVTEIWRGANWHEREAFDLYGIQFHNHPDLRRILLPADWVGFPMRKDYDEAANYHGMTIKHPDALKEN